MKMVLTFTLGIVLCSAAAASAQNPAQEASPSDLQMQTNPEIYLYLRALERYEDPRQAIRRRAEVKAAERRGRLASQKWYGVSPLRPFANPLPWMSTYSPRWVGNGSHPYYWHGFDYIPTAAVRVETVRK